MKYYNLKVLGKRALVFLDREAKFYMFLYGLYFGVVIFLLFVGYSSVSDSWSNVACTTICTNSSVFAMIAGIAATFIGVSLPIGNQIVSNQLRDYYHIQIIEIFHNSWTYRAQVFNSFILFIETLVLTLWDTSKDCEPGSLKIGLTLLTAFSYTIAVICFFLFMKRVRAFTINAEGEVIKYLKKEIENDLP